MSKFISLEFAAFGSGPKVKPSRASGFRFFLSMTILFAWVRKFISGKKHLCLSQSRVTSRKKRPEGAVGWACASKPTECGFQSSNVFFFCLMTGQHQQC